MRAMLESIGFADAVLARETPEGLQLIDGHLRQEVVGDAEVPVLVLDVSADEARQLLLSLDPLAGMAETDTEALSALMADVAIGSEELLAYLEAQLPKEMAKGLTDPDEAPEPPTEPVSKLGDLWLLGEHRVLCGDARNADALAHLMAGQAADLLWTDPPYGVAYQTKLSIEEAVARHRRTDGLEVGNDTLTGDALREFLVRAFVTSRAILSDGASFYICTPGGEAHVQFWLALGESDLPIRQSVVWVKDVFVMGRQDYHWRHETLLYGWKPGAAHRFVADRSLDTVWEIARPKRSKEHPTMKPVELVERGIANSSLRGGRVLDPFLGSGSTLIAAERTGRVCYGLELDPRYVDVVVKRWEDFTGNKAELANAATTQAS